MNEYPRQTIPTEMTGLLLVELTAEDAQPYYDLVDRNRVHLTQHGDYMEMRHATLASVVESLSDPEDKNAKFGIWLNGTLIGRVDLSPRTPGYFVVGYWLGGDYTGNGYATSACRSLIQYGRRRLGAAVIFAGVTKGNAESERLLDRLGFQRAEDRGAFTLFRLDVSEHDGSAHL